MTLRTRVALLVGVIAASAMFVGGLWSYAAVSDEQYSAVDRFLERRNEAPGQLDRIPVPPPGTIALEGIRQQIDDGVIFQVTAPDGAVLVTSDPDVVLGLPDLGTLGELRTITIDGERFRVGADTNAGGNIVQLARSLAEADATVGAIRRRLWLLGIVVSAIAAGLGWLLAAWTTRPLERLTAVVDHVAGTRDLDVPLDMSSPGSGRSEVHRLSASFSTMLAALRRSREQQRQLVGDAGHEMRTPLTTLRANAELLQSGRLTDDDRARSLDAIVREVDELTKLTNELVELSASDDAGESVRPIDVFDIATAATERGAIRHRRRIELLGTRCSADGQPAALDRAVTNLIDNAAKFSPPDAAITVTVESGRLAVRDHGPGIGADDRARVFERFYRADAVRTLPGSGLGLAIVAKVAADHGGAAFVDDPDDGQGAIVGFTFATAR
ncbi:MAG: HAMP domain-containing sensor histidine kinase [Ilumatobacteraceae bacterium]|nr:HAMP domain-containing sensor histidine kinase [Ilumatobacteraceae bacterium]